MNYMITSGQQFKIDKIRETFNKKRKQMFIESIILTNIKIFTKILEKTIWNFFEEKLQRTRGKIYDNSERDGETIQLRLTYDKYS